MLTIKKSRHRNSRNSKTQSKTSQSKDSNSKEGTGVKKSGSSHTSSQPYIKRTREIKEEVMANYTEDGKFVHCAGSNEDDLAFPVALLSEVGFDNDHLEARSPPGESPQLSGAQLSVIATEMSANDYHRGGNIWHVILSLSVMFSFERYLSFPLVAVHNGGYAYLIPFFIVTALITWPTMCLEIFIGQYTSQLPAIAFQYILPLSKGLSVIFPLVRITRLLSVRSDPLIMHYLNDFMFALFFGNRQYTCYEQGKYCIIKHKKACDLYIDGGCYKKYDKKPRQHTLAIRGRDIVTHKPVPNIQYVHLQQKMDVTLCYMTIFLTFYAFLLLRMRIDRFSKLSSVLFIFPILAIIMALILFVTQFHPVSYSIPSDFKILMDPMMWGHALFTSLEMYSVGDGSLHALGSLMPFNYNSYRVILTAIPTSFFLIVLSWLFVIPVANRDTGNNIVFARNLTKRHPYLENYMSVEVEEGGPHYHYMMVFFAIGLFLSQFPYIVLALHSIRTRLLRSTLMLQGMNERILMQCYIAAVCVASSIAVTLFLQNRAIIRVFYWICRMVLPVVILMEVVLISHVYGRHRFAVNMQSMFGHRRIFIRTYKLLGMLWAYVIPVLCVLVIISPLMVHMYFIHSFVLMNTFVSSFLFLVAVYMITYQLIHRRPMVSLLRRHFKWGPLNIRNRRKAAFDEKAARIFG